GHKKSCPWSGRVQDGPSRFRTIFPSPDHRRRRGIFMLRTLGLVSFIICVLAGSSFASTYYVANTGSNANSCTQAQSQASPRLTIQAGVNCATNAGDVVIVKAGTYIESVTNWPASGSSGNPITIKANPGDTVSWRGSGSDVSSLTGAISIMDRSYIRIEG